MKKGRCLDTLDMDRRKFLKLMAIAVLVKHFHRLIPDTLRYRRFPVYPRVV
jgi:hypothetical protein